MVPAVPAVVPEALPAGRFLLMGTLAPGTADGLPAVPGDGRVELSSTFQAIPIPQADEKFNGNTHPRYRRPAAGKLLIC